MDVRRHHQTASLDDEELRETALHCAEVIRSFARRCQRRARSGHLNGAQAADAERILGLLEEAATALEERRAAPPAPSAARGPAPAEAPSGAPEPVPPRAPEALTASEERFRILVESVRDYAIYMLDPEGRVVSWNQGAEHLKGYSETEILGRHFSVFFTEEDRRRGHPEEELVRARELGRHAEEGWRVRKDGTTFWASVTLTAIVDREGRHVGYAKVTRDMTARREAEQALRKAKEDLEVRVRERTAELIAINRELESFSHSISHDLRAPLRALDGFSRLLLERAEDRLAGEEKHYLARIRAAAQQMSQLIDALLSLSRISRVPPSVQRVDASGICRQIVEELREADPDRDVEVSIQDGVVISGDARLLRLLFQNLLQNAWKFTAKQPAARIEVGTILRDGATIYFVRDNGVGFDMSHADRLFTPFQRLHRARDFEGTGIGLATAQRIVARHHGRIWAEAAPGQGATFYFTVEAARGT